MATSTLSCQKAAVRSLLSQCTSQQYHRPRFATPINASQCLFSRQRRQFSQSPRQAYPGARVDPRAAGMKSGNRQARPSMKVTMKKAQKEMGNTGQTGELIVKDFGLLPETLIYPTGANLPPFTTLRRPKFIWRWIRQRIGDIVSTYWIYRHSIPSRPLYKFYNLRALYNSRQSIPPTAKEIHQRVYRAFADGNKKGLTTLCVETVLGQYLNRLAQRPEGERMRWEVVEYLEKPRLVSHRAAQLPMMVEGTNAGVKQCVVRIKTLQRLQVGTVRSEEWWSGKAAGSSGAKTYGMPSKKKKSVSAEGEATEASIEWRAPAEKQVTEYVVIQRWLVKGKEQPWVLWGFVDETVDLDEAYGAAVGEVGMKPLE